MGDIKECIKRRQGKVLQPITEAKAELSIADAKKLKADLQKGIAEFGKIKASAELSGNRLQDAVQKLDEFLKYVEQSGYSDVTFQAKDLKRILGSDIKSSLSAMSAYGKAAEKIRTTLLSAIK